MLVALVKTGVILQAASEVGISAATYYQWCKDEDWFRRRAEQILNDTKELRRGVLAERLSKASRARWDDPGRREAWSEYQRSNWSEQKRAAAAERARQHYADPEARAAWEAATAAARNSPEGRARYARHSEFMRKRWAEDPEYRAKIIAAGQTPESRKLRSEAARQQWASLTPDARAEKLRKMRRVLKGGHRLTAIEAAVMLALNERELPYLTHKDIEGYVADIYIPSLKLIVECDGAWFHLQRQDSDAERDAILASLGFQTIRLTEVEITSKDWTRLDEIIEQLSTEPGR
jgi:very-short-patch-repair endonuclease